MIIDNIEHDWKIFYGKDKLFPYLYIDNWYTKEEEEYVWKELDYWSSLGFESSETIIAKDIKTNESLGKHLRIYLNEMYTAKAIPLSPTWAYTYKFRSPEFHKILDDFSPMYLNFKATTNTSHFLSYYDQSHYYDSHYDAAPFTCLIYFYKKPKNFKGGDLEFFNGDKVKCEQNRMVIFPGWGKHASTPLKLKNKNLVLSGKYTITHFYFGIPLK